MAWGGEPSIAPPRAPVAGQRAPFASTPVGRPATFEFEDALRAGWVDVETMILPAGLHGELIHTRGALGRQALELISDRVGLQSG